MNSFNWWEITDTGRMAIVRRKKAVADALVKKQGPKIHFMRVSGMRWRTISSRLVASENTLQQRYKRWLERNPDLVAVSATDAKKHVAWELCKEYTQAQAAELMGVNRKTLNSWIRRWDEDRDQNFVSAAAGGQLTASDTDILPGVPRGAARASKSL